MEGRGPNRYRRPHLRLGGRIPPFVVPQLPVAAARRSKAPKTRVLLHDDPTGPLTKDLPVPRAGARPRRQPSRSWREPGDVVSAAHCHLDRPPDRIVPEIALKAAAEIGGAKHPPCWSRRLHHRAYLKLLRHRRPVAVVYVRRWRGDIRAGSDEPPRRGAPRSPRHARVELARTREVAAIVGCPQSETRDQFRRQCVLGLPPRRRPYRHAARRGGSCAVGGRAAHRPLARCHEPVLDGTRPLDARVSSSPRQADDATLKRLVIARRASRFAAITPHAGDERPVRRRLTSA